MASWLTISRAGRKTGLNILIPDFSKYTSFIIFHIVFDSFPSSMEPVNNADIKDVMS